MYTLHNRGDNGWWAYLTQKRVWIGPYPTQGDADVAAYRATHKNYPGRPKTK